jgi:predicted GNAT family acetyltransferase
MTWVASADGEVAGFIACEPDGHVDLAFVHPSHQGRGVARALHAEVEAEARRRRLARLFTEASLAARPFFERAGYRVLHHNDVRVADQVLTNWSLDRRLVPLTTTDRIFVVGNSGSGKTTFARALAERLGRPHLDLDAVAFSDQAGTRRPVEASVERLSSTPDFDARPVVEGCYADLVQALAGADDHLVWLDLPVAECVENARARPWEPHKWPSADAQDAFLPRLIGFIEGYPTDPTPTGRPAHAQLFSDFPGAREAHRVRPAFDP